jgi:AcrR family transcriptional regulator
VAASQTVAPLRADARANRAAVLAAASQLIGRDGRDVSFDEIAKAAGVGRATLYRHFPTRESLLVGILDEAVCSLEQVATYLVPGPDGFTTLLEKAWRDQVDGVPFSDLVPASTAMTPEVRAFQKRIEKLFRGPLREAQAAGRVRGDLTVDDVRVQLLMLTAVQRTDTPRAERERAWRLALAALGVTP